jgi:hypothetical protein
MRGLFRGGDGFAAGDKIDGAEFFRPTRTGMRDANQVNEGIRRCDAGGVGLGARRITVNDLARFATPSPAATARLPGFAPESLFPPVRNTS